MASAEARSAGVVVWFNDQKGYGFIKADKGDAEYFVHRLSITNADSDGVKTLREQDAVEFSVGAGKGNRPMAVDVTVTVPNTAPPKATGAGKRSNSGDSDKTCYNCGKPGHTAKYCRAAVVIICYKCGKQGHFSRNCNAAKGGDRSQVDDDGFRYVGKVKSAVKSGCYTCGRYGHFARNCPQKQGKGGVGKFDGRSKSECYNCWERGHRQKECPNPTRV